MQLAIIGVTGMLGHHAAEAVVAAGHELTVVLRASTSLDRLKRHWPTHPVVPEVPPSEKSRSDRLLGQSRFHLRTYLTVRRDLSPNSCLSGEARR